MRRARGSGGRFLNTKKVENAATDGSPDKEDGDSSAAAQASNKEMAYLFGNGNKNSEFQAYSYHSYSDGRQVERPGPTIATNRSLTIK